MFQGVVPPIPTPLTADEAIDEEGARRLLELDIAGGVSALWVFGTTGRFDLVTDNVQRQFAELVVEIVGGRVPLILNVSDLGTRRVLDKASRFDDLPYDAYAVLCPWYQPMSHHELTDFFERLADELARPVLIYNAPWVNNMLSFDHLRELAEHPRIVGCKDVTTFYGRPMAWPRREREAVGFSYLVGATLFTSAADLGADGCVTGISGMFPELCVSAWEAAAQGDHVAAARFQKQFMILSEALQLGHYMSCLEVMYRHRGLGQYITAHPIPRLDETTAARVIEAVKSSGALDEQLTSPTSG